MKQLLTLMYRIQPQTKHDKKSHLSCSFLLETLLHLEIKGGWGFKVVFNHGPTLAITYLELILKLKLI